MSSDEYADAIEFLTRGIPAPDEDALVLSVHAQLEDEPPGSRIRVLSLALADEVIMLTKEEFHRELLRIRFGLMRINGVLASEGRPNRALFVAQQLIDEQIEVLAPEAE